METIKLILAIVVLPIVLLLVWIKDKSMSDNPYEFNGDTIEY